MIALSSAKRAAYDGNAAYEYPRFEDKRKEIKSVPRKSGARPKTFNAAKAIVCMLMVVALASTLVYTRVVQTELINDYNQMTGKVDSLKSENAALQLELETKLSLSNIEAYAKEQLAMSELKNQQVEYINFDAQNKAEVIDQESFWEDILGWFNGLVH